MLVLSGGGNIIEGSYSYDELEFNKYADILEYSDSENWTRVGEMSVARIGVAVSVVSFDDYKKHCQ